MVNPFLIQAEDKNIKDRKVAEISLRQEEGNYLPDQEPEKAALALPIKKGQLYLFFILVFCLIFVIFVRLFWLQIIKGEEYLNLAEGNRIKTISIKADRGLIYDCSGNLLVKNKPYFSLIFLPQELPKEQEKRKVIFDDFFLFLKNNSISEDLFLENKQRMEKIFEEKIDYDRESELWKDIDYFTAMKLDLNIGNWPGFYLRIKAQREYLKNELAAHFLGYLGKLSQEEIDANPDYLVDDFIGKEGLELFYEKELRGQDGKREIEVNSIGDEERIISQENPKTGQDLILSLDFDLQNKVSQVLKKYINSTTSQAGSVVILNPQNGEILSLFSWPSYDNNSFVKGTPEKYLNDPQRPLFFRAISGEYPSGSVIKPIIAAAGLMEGLIDAQTKILSQGGFWVKEWFFTDWKQGGHGITDVVKALAESVNTFFYYLGGGFGNFEGLGPERIYSYAKLFGLTEPTGIDLYGESKGLVATPKWKRENKKEDWYIGDTYHLAIGQGDILVTPIQVANYTAAIANNGTLFQPRLVKYFQDPDLKTKIETASKIIRKDFIDQETLDIVKKGLRAAVEWGSARRLSLLPVEVAGKTGTAQIGTSKNSHAWFTGFAPFDNPEIVITVLLENGGGGDTVAVPVAFEILDYYFSKTK